MGSHHSSPAPTVITHNAYDYAPTAAGTSMTSDTHIQVNSSGKNDSLDYDPSASGGGVNYVGSISGHGVQISGITNTAALMNLASPPQCATCSNNTIIHTVYNQHNLVLKSDQNGNLCFDDLT